MSDKDFNPLDYAWGKLAFGALFVWLAFSLNGTFTELETGVRDSARLNWAFALLYRTFGRQVSVGLVGVISALSLLFGLRQLIRPGK